MCFRPDSEPPIEPISGAAVDHRDVTLTAADGNEFVAFEAVSGGPTGVVILPDIRGLYRYYEELALRFAERGHDAIAVDYYGRTAGAGKRDADFPWQDHLPLVTFAGVKADMAAAVSWLRADDAQRPVFVIGFCFGGSNSWHQAANGFGIAGAIGFYGHPTRPDSPQGADPVISRVGDMDCPILGLMGGDDPGIPHAEVDRYRDALSAAGIDSEIIVYPGAPHSFFDRHYEQYADESADAWKRVLAFMERNSSAR